MHGCYAMTATTALTAQSTEAVHSIHHTPPTFVAQQIDTTLSDIGCRVLKTGMLASAETISVVVRAIRRYSISTVVVDPVMVATSGSVLLPTEAVRTMRLDLLPLATVLTPNVPEAKMLLRDAGIAEEEMGLEMREGEVDGAEGMVRLAKMVLSLGPKYVLLKGGHAPMMRAGTKTVLDVLVGGDRKDPMQMQTKWVEGRNKHGTGCSLAAAIAGRLAQGHDMEAAISLAFQYSVKAVQTAWGAEMGKGNGPINHLYCLRRGVSGWEGHEDSESCEV